MTSLSFATVGLIALQGLFLFLDEILFHQKREVGFWESLGHPLDSLGFALPLLIAGFGDFAQPAAFTGYVALSAVSTLLVTKDEWIHSRKCVGTEHWFHAMLFILHPTILFCVGILWQRGEAPVLRQALPLVVFSFTFYQLYLARRVHHNAAQY